LLLAAAGIAFFIGESGDSIVILAVVLLNSVIGTIQEGRAEHSIESLRRLSKLKAHVIRQGQEQAIEASEIVPGDILILNPGDAVAADARLVESVAVASAEAALTGESVPVQKTTESLDETTPLSDRQNMVYAGT